MKAIVYNKKNLSDKLQYCNVEKPIPKKNEILIEVHAVSPNAADYRSLKMGMIPKKKIFGSGIAGIVESVGSDVKQFKPGDNVIGDLSDSGFGGFAEYALTTEKALVHKPETVSFEEAATLPIASTTAFKALRDKGHIQKGFSTLIVGSSGGVGTFAVQLARYFGARITAVCSTKNMEQSMGLGANSVIDYTKEDFINSKSRYDLIIAINGNYPLLGYRKILKRNGTYVMVGGSISQIFKSIFLGWILSMGSKKMSSLSAKVNQEDLAFVAKLVEGKHIKPIIEQRYTLAETAEAMNLIASGHASGKMVVNIK